jgi:hypothetical protein
LTTVGQLLDFLPQIMDRYRWSPEDVSLRHLPAVDASQAEAAAPGFYVCFRRKLPPEQTQYLARIIHAQFACEAIAVPPGLSLYPLPRFLEESFPLVPSIPSRGGYQDLLVAVYEEESFARIYESFPKNPQYHQSPEIWFLEGLPGAEEGAAANRPVCLFTVPRAPVDERPAQWLQMSNRRRADGSDLFKLFCRLPARRGSADYYVEFGWRHPVSHLPELHAADGARWILITADPASGEEQTAAPGWINIQPAAVALEFTGSAASVFDIRLPRHVGHVTLAPGQPRKYTLEARLCHLAAERRNELDKLEQQIQAAKERLFRMERQRNELLRRKRSRFRFLLRFKQDEDDSSLCPRFQRFLTVSEPQLERFQYVYQDDELGAYHVVLTEDVCHYEELHLYLADEVYYQKEHWHEWSFNVFVMDHFALQPAVDDPQLKEIFRNALNEAFGGPDILLENRCLVLRPRGYDATHHTPELPFDVISIDVPRDHPRSLLAAFEFLNVRFAAPERKARQAGVEQLKAELNQQAEVLRAEIAQLETDLTIEAEERLAKLHGQWNELSDQIEHNYDLVRDLQGYHQVVENMIGRASHCWSEFVAQVFAVTVRAVAERRQAWDQLLAKADPWEQILAGYEPSLRTIREELSGLGAELELRVQQAEAGRESVRCEYDKTKARFETLKPPADAAADDVSNMLRAAERDAAELEETKAEVREHCSRAQQLVERVVEGAKWLATHEQCFSELLAEARRNVEQSQENLGELQPLAAHVGQLDAEWERLHNHAEEVSRQAADLQEQGAERIPEYQRQVGSLIATARPLLRQVGKRIAVLEPKRKRAAETVELLETKCRDLEGLAAEASKLASRLAEAEQGKEKQTAELEGLEKNFWFQRRRKAGELEARLRELMDDLQILTEMESELQAVADLQQRTGPQARFAAEYAKCRALTGEEHRSIWAGARSRARPTTGPEGGDRRPPGKVSRIWKKLRAWWS